MNNIKLVALQRSGAIEHHIEHLWPPKGHLSLRALAFLLLCVNENKKKFLDLQP